MYEYVQTPTGWVLCWGGAALHREPAEAARPAVAARDDREAGDKKQAANEPIATLAA